MDRADIAEFWQGTLKELAEVPIDAEVAESDPDGVLTEYVKTFQNHSVRMSSFEGVKIRGWYTTPIGTPPPGGWPAIVTVPGYRGVQPLPLHYTRYGYATLALSPRGQGESEQEWKIDHGGYASYNLFDKNKYFYRGAYADCVRGVDFLASRPEINKNRIGCWGMSQGGGLVLALGALDPRIKIVAAEVAWPTEMRKLALSTAPAARDIRTVIMQNPDKQELILSNLDFFDPLNMVSSIRCPVLMNAAHVDDLHVYDSLMKVFNKIPTRKAMFAYPHLEHGARADFARHTLDWFDRFMH